MSLPPHVRRGTEPVLARKPLRITSQDVRDFLVAYCACFVCVSAFIG